MAKIVKTMFVTMTSVKKISGDSYPKSDWRHEHKGQGLLIIIESERKYPGQKFINFFKYLDNDECLELTTTFGEFIENIDEDYELHFLTKNSEYVFVKSTFLTQRQKCDMIANILYRPHEARRIEKGIQNVAATMSVEGMDLSKKQVEVLRQIGNGKITCEQAIEDVKSKYKQKDEGSLMRNPDRIEPFLAELGTLWKEKYPDWRFGQLMGNFFREMGDPFYLEEDEFMAAFKAFCDGEDTQVAIMNVYKKKLDEQIKKTKKNN